MDSAIPLIRTRLSLMMFLEYFVWSSWVVSIGGYMSETLRFDGSHRGWIFSTTALGAMISPLVLGYIADRYFSTEKVLSVLHLIGGIALCLAAGQKEFPPLMTLMMISALCYMPTLALTNSLAFRNIARPERDFPIIRVWGTIGWILAGLMVGIVLGGTEKLFFYLAGGSGILMSLYCWTLPHTPPKGPEQAESDVFGFRALGLLQERSFGVFVVSAFLACLVLSFYWTGANVYLTETDRPVPTALQTLGQISEIFFMAALPFFLARLGVKNMLVLGIFAWVIEYLCFASLWFPLALLGLLLHGVCYNFFFMAAFIYVDQKAPRDLRASAQSFLAFVTYGLGMLAGNTLSGEIVDRCPPAVTIAAADAQGAVHPGAPLPAWPATEPYTGFWGYLDVSATLRGWLLAKQQTQEPVVSLAKQLGSEHDDRIALAQIEKLPEEGVQIGTLRYAKQDFVEAFKKVDRSGSGVVSRSQWRAAQAHQWSSIWLWPAALAALASGFLWLGFQEKSQGQKAP